MLRATAFENLIGATANDIVGDVRRRTRAIFGN
jgi:hypothetical protein